MGMFIAFWIAGLFVGLGIGNFITRRNIKQRLKDRGINTSEFDDIL